MSYEPIQTLQQNYEIENELSFLMEPKSSESVDYVFKDESDFDEELLHDKSFMSNGSEQEIDTPTSSSLINEIEYTDGYFKRDLMPMLSKGHEGELCQYLKDIGVLKSSMRCGTESCEGLRMTWTAARVVDKYQWSCTKCKKRKSIREESFFKGMKFVLPIVLRAMQGWCGNYDPEELAQNMGLKPYAFRQVYSACREVAAKHIQNVLANEILGGPNTVVILEVWSSGLKGAVVPIAGLIELKDNKIKYFYQPLRYNQQCFYANEEANKTNIKNLLAKVQENETNNNTFPYNANNKRKNSESNEGDSPKKICTNEDTTETEDNKSEVQTKPKSRSRSKSQKDITGDLQMLIKQKVAPATLLVLGNGISLTVANNLMRSDLNMNAVKTLDNIRCVENKDNPLSDIISLLLQRPSEVISLAREIPRSQLQQFLSMHLWYDNYTNINDINKNSLEVLLHQIAAIDYGADAESFDYTKPSIEIILNEDS